VRGSVGLASPRRGSGIGLSVVRLLIEAMGGRVQVADNPGGGADFQLLLPGLANVITRRSLSGTGVLLSHRVG
jgi:signal transduction histidine kinase